MSAIERAVVSSAKTAGKASRKRGIGSRAKGQYRKLIGHKPGSVKVTENPRSYGRHVEIKETGSSNRFTNPRIHETDIFLTPGRRARQTSFTTQERHLKDGTVNAIGAGATLGVVGAGSAAAIAADNRTHKKAMQKVKKNAVSAFGVSHG